MYEETGRFISPDSTGQKLDDPQTLNRYSYCTNNPLKYIDPSGHDQVIVTNNDGTYTIMDGNGKLLANASEIDDLAQKMKDVECKSRQVDLPLQPQAAAYINSLEQQVLFPTEVPEIQDFFGAFTNLPNTVIGLGLGMTSGGTFENGPRGTVVVTNINPNSLIGRLMSQIEGDPITVGYVILTKAPGMTLMTERHELGHVTQGGRLSIFYLPVVWIDSMIHKNWGDRWIERTVPPLK